jgi:hypothetical protein
MCKIFMLKHHCTLPQERASRHCHFTGTCKQTLPFHRNVQADTAVSQEHAAFYSSQLYKVSREVDVRVLVAEQ